MIPTTIRTDETVYKVETKDGYYICNKEHLKDVQKGTIFELGVLGFKFVKSVSKKQKSKPKFVLDSYSFYRDCIVIKYDKGKGVKEISNSIKGLSLILSKNGYTLEDLRLYKINFSKLEQIFKEWLQN